MASTSAIFRSEFFHYARVRVRARKKCFALCGSGFGASVDDLAGTAGQK